MLAVPGAQLPVIGSGLRSLLDASHKPEGNILFGNFLPVMAAKLSSPVVTFGQNFGSGGRVSVKFGRFLRVERSKFML